MSRVSSSARCATSVDVATRSRPAMSFTLATSSSSESRRKEASNSLSMCASIMRACRNGTFEALTANFHGPRPSSSVGVMCRDLLPRISKLVAGLGTSVCRATLARGQGRQLAGHGRERATQLRRPPDLEREGQTRQLPREPAEAVDLPAEDDSRPRPFEHARGAEELALGGLEV